MTINLRFPGQYFDYESGLHYNWNRFYSPAVGRYISPDIIGVLGGINLYSYVSGNPMRFVDMRGLYSLGDAEVSLSQKGVKPEYDYPKYDIYKYSDTQVFNEWLDLERANDDWLKELTPCPRHIEICVKKSGEKIPINPNPEKWKDPGKINWGNEHGNAFYEMRSKRTLGGHANQCTYDEQGNVYDVGTHPEAGTADFVSMDESKLGHASDDLWPWKMAQSLGREADYYAVRPPVVEGK